MTSKSEKIKPVALAIIKLHLLEGISQLVQLVENFLNFLLEGFMVNLKTFLGLTMPNQSCQTVV